MRSETRLELPYRPSVPAVTEHGLVSAPTGPVLLIGRDLCSYAWIDQRGHSDRAARRREAEFEGLRMALSLPHGLYVVLWEDGAGVWTWDEGKIRQELQRAERDDLLDLPRAPEPIMLWDGAQILEENVSDVPAVQMRLVLCMEGMEGQIWRKGQLVGSRWWRNLPSDRDWSLFAASAGLENVGTPKPHRAEPLKRPWMRNEYRPNNAELVDRRASFWGAAALAASLIAGAAYTIGVEVKYGVLQSKAAALEEKAAPIRTVQRRVLSLAAEERKISETLREERRPLQLVSSLAAVVARSGVRVNELELKDDRMVVSLPRIYLDKVDVVLRALEKDPAFSGARLADSGMSDSDIRIQVESQTAP